MPDVKKPASTLIFPMEIVERELSGNLLLAIEAVRRGWQVVLGTKKAVFDAAPYLPDGLVFLKSMMACEAKNMRRLKAEGHRLVCLDVEGLVYTSAEEFVTVRFSPETMDEIDMALFWGECQKGAVANGYPAHAHKLHTTGTPIVDLWRPYMHDFYKERVDALRSKYGKYILIPSSFASVNHFMGENANAGIIERDDLIAEDKRDEFFEFWREYENHVKGIFEKFLLLIPGLSRAFPDHKIIIRPHPSESHERWKSIAKDLSNVEVIFEGSVSPWLLGADAILHWGCTTGVEGYLMDKPVVAYNPSDDLRFDHKIPHCISIMTHTEDEVFAALKDVISRPEKILEDYPSVSEGEKYLRQWIKYSDERPSVLDVMDNIEKIQLRESSPLFDIPSPHVHWKEYIWRALDHLHHFSIVSAFMPQRLKLGLNSRAYGKHKTRDIDYADLSRSVETLATLCGVNSISVKKIGSNLFSLQPDRSDQ